MLCDTNEASRKVSVAGDVLHLLLQRELGFSVTDGAHREALIFAEPELLLFLVRMITSVQTRYRYCTTALDLLILFLDLQSGVPPEFWFGRTTGIKARMLPFACG